MTKVEEVHELSVVIPVLKEVFLDDKEISEVFKYAFELSKIHNFSHYPNTFKKVYDRGNDVYKFTISVDSHNAETIPKRKEELEELVTDYNRIEKEYIRFRTFGNIESCMLIRKGPNNVVRDD